MMRRGPEPKFNGLQSKFQDFLLKKIKVGEKVSGKEISKLLDATHKKFQITDEELADLKNNWSNYTYRAKVSGILQSHGQRKGYSIIKQSDSRSDQPTPIAKDAASEKEIPSDLIEAFLHIPLTFLLSEEFNSRVISMPGILDKLKWANPDMLMIRDSPNYYVLRSEQSISQIKLIDSSPQYILSSVEIKFNIGTNRTNVLNALYQTASHGLWANETWLIFFDDDSTETDFDPDSIAFASATGVGIKRMIIKTNSTTAGAPSVILETILNPQIRNNIRLNPAFSADGDRKNLMDEIVRIVEKFDQDGADGGSYLDREGQYVKLADLLLNAHRNIIKQSGYTSKEEIKKRLTKLSKNSSINDLLKATRDWILTFSMEIESINPEQLINTIKAKITTFQFKDVQEIQEFYELIDNAVKEGSAATSSINK